jgi:hypothetical protein
MVVTGRRDDTAPAIVVQITTCFILSFGFEPLRAQG